MADEVLRLGIDPQAAKRGAAEFAAAASRVSSSARVATGRVKQLEGGFSTLKRHAGLLKGALAIVGITSLISGLRSGIQGFLDFDSAMTQSLAIMGNVSSFMKQEMARTAREVGAALGFAAKQGAEAFFFLASAGLDARQSVAALPAVAEFAKAGMFDFATATDLATDAQSALGLASKDAQKNLESMTRVTDVLVKANTLANANVQQFSEALTNEAGAALKTFNIDVEEGVAVLSAFADQGVKGDVAGSSLARVLRLMGSAAVNNKEAMAALGVEVFDEAGNMRNLGDVVGSLETALAGMSDEQRIAKLESIGFQARVQGVILPLLGASEKIKAYEVELRKAGGTTKEVADNQMKSLENRIAQVRVRFQNWRDDVVKGMVPAMELLLDNADVLGAALLALAGAAGLVAGAFALTWINGAIAGFVTLTSTVLSLVPAITSLADVMYLLNAALGPAGWFIAGVGLLTTAIIAWRRHQRGQKEELEGIAAAADTAAASFKELSQEQLQNRARQIRSDADLERGKISKWQDQIASGKFSSGTVKELEDAIGRARERGRALGQELQLVENALNSDSIPGDGLKGTARDAAEAAARLEKLEERIASLNKKLEDGSDLMAGYMSDALAAGEATVGRSAGTLAGMTRSEVDLVNESMQGRFQMGELPALSAELSRKVEDVIMKMTRAGAGSLDAGAAFTELTDILHAAGKTVADLPDGIREWAERAAAGGAADPGGGEGIFGKLKGLLGQGGGQGVLAAAGQVLPGKLGSVVQSISGVASAFASGGPLLGGIAAAGAAFKVVSGIFRKNKVSLEDFGKSITAVVSKLQNQFKLLNIEDPKKQFELMVEQANRIYGVGKRGKEEREFFGGLTTENFSDRIQKLYDSGFIQNLEYLAATASGATQSLAQQELNFILSLSDMADAASSVGKELNKVAVNIPEALPLDYLRQVIGAGAMLTAGASDPGSAGPTGGNGYVGGSGGSGGGAKPREGTYVDTAMSFSAGAIVVQAGGKSGAEILDEIEAEIKRRKGSGQSVAMDQFYQAR